MNIEITHMSPLHLPGATSDVVAQFDAIIGPFRMRSCKVRRAHEGGEIFVALAGRRDSNGITLSDPDVREAVKAAALEAYHGS